VGSNLVEATIEVSRFCGRRKRKEENKRKE